LRHPVLFAKVHLAFNPGVLYATPARARRFLFSTEASATNRFGDTPRASDGNRSGRCST
jgi:hypothetical protein